ncbi:acetyl-CoA carboxylase biotin carboxyl carrier protein [Paraclostridium sordellii]|uniref:acetyl-CoA carboxylase biotin carboxyl carrier protein n=1 Tax=Paraclostridium sordellii TaxID=1505 RepID=UPI0005E49555|nr:acetyl-CoA carboxylase biotin carboxyl carrier protein [Paeniclostridium sordellii]CEO08836.1 acetyl-CoA carboxylase subunit [[Clostridium] sordellii] [Paeniclostridium sordellii]CEP87356.1 acetyl-CoA carboxylase subunit [[Clostridium] sordellii] [Paeniclostridium sordellii]CEP95698.1 acetyl-CoA carboxylase subunit [[Clostridium] sordellii] [Paeniclostridium sordellii]CEP98963.1 acetyl-CoA carboxylase subunit [[Clostridium] sordellii] [Paeniclostridium sordellii]
MNINEIKELILTIDKTNLTYVNLKDKDFSLEVSKLKELSNASINQDIESIQNDNENVNQEKLSNKINNSNEFIIENEDLHLITSPIMGTYYGSPSPEDDCFVKVGDKVKAGDTLCIIEAMKLMNEIISDIDGEIVEIVSKNEDLVEYNQVLFKIKEFN